MQAQTIQANDNSANIDTEKIQSQQQQENSQQLKNIEDNIPNQFTIEQQQHKKEAEQNQQDKLQVIEQRAQNEQATLKKQDNMQEKQQNQSEEYHHHDLTQPQLSQEQDVVEYQNLKNQQKNQEESNQTQSLLKDQLVKQQQENLQDKNSFTKYKRQLQYYNEEAQEKDENVNHISSFNSNPEQLNNEAHLKHRRANQGKHSVGKSHDKLVGDEQKYTLGKIKTKHKKKSKNQQAQATMIANIEFLKLIRQKKKHQAIIKQWIQQPRQNMSFSESRINKLQQLGFSKSRRLSKKLSNNNTESMILPQIRTKNNRSISGNNNSYFLEKPIISFDLYHVNQKRNELFYNFKL